MGDDVDDGDTIVILANKTGSVHPVKRYRWWEERERERERNKAQYKYK